MISVDEFGQLRASDYLPEADLGYSDDWRFLGRVWNAASCGFSDFLSAPETPEVTACICISFEDLPAHSAARLLSDLDIGLSPGMNLNELRGLLGEAVREQSFRPDRTSYEFRVGEFTVDATIDHKDGLVYLVIHPLLPPA